MPTKGIKMGPRLVEFLYWKKGFSQREIAERFGLGQSTISKFMKGHGISARHKGFVPWNKGKTGVFSKEARRKISEANLKKVDLSPTKKLGYFCGLVIGDGSLYFCRPTRNYEMRFQSTKEDIVKLFCELAEDLGLHPLGIYTYKRTRRFPNGEKRTDLIYSAVVNSKILYDALRPYKQKDYYWKIPRFLTTKESLFGFVGGIFDAEGYAGKNGVIIGSKHDENLIRFKRLLKKLGFIYGRISVKNGRLTMFGIGNIRLLLEKAELHLKKKKVQSVFQNRPRRHTREEYEEVIKLRKQKELGGRRISKETNIPVSTIEDWVYRGKVPWELKITKERG